MGAAKVQVVELSDGRLMPLEDLIRDYERLSKERMLKQLRVGEWFWIDREVIYRSKEEIRRKCNEAGTEGKALWKRFEKSNEIADKNPDQYPYLIETYIFEYSWEYKTEQEMRDMCEDVGDGMCDEVICDLELQMRICKGESVDDLLKKADKLPRIRVIKLRNGGIGLFGGGSVFNLDIPPASLNRYDSSSSYEYCTSTPYAFRRVLP